MARIEINRGWRPPQDEDGKLHVSSRRGTVVLRLGDTTNDSGWSLFHAFAAAANLLTIDALALAKIPSTKPAVCIVPRTRRTGANGREALIMAEWPPLRLCYLNRKNISA
jgi:hypothetical protein